MTPEKRAAAGRKGGKAAHAFGAGGHEWTPIEASRAGAKGGRARKGKTYVEKRPKAPPGPRGFAAMPPEKRAAVARKGGKAAHKLGVGHTFKKGAEAVVAGRRGGRARAVAERKRKAEKPPKEES